MKKNLLFLLIIGSLFSGNLFSMDKNNWILGGTGLAVLGCSTVLNYTTRKWFGEEYSTVRAKAIIDEDKDFIDIYKSALNSCNCGCLAGASVMFLAFLNHKYR